MSKKPTNITGFDMKKLVASSKMPTNDPWARHEAWRYQGPFTRANRFKGILPGFGTAVVAFAIYCGYEYVFLKDSHHSASGHGESTTAGH